MKNKGLLDKHAVEIVKWHFDEATGSRYWLKKAKALPFDPLKDIKCYSDLRLFPDFSDELRFVPIEELVPAGLAKEGWVPDIYESGGATGKPKRIVEADSRIRGVEWINAVLDLHHFPSGAENGAWLFVGPTGPHIVGRSMGRLAKLRGAMCYYLDFDPRWVRKCLKSNNRDIANMYIEHIVGQVKDIVSDQNIGVMFVTPLVLEKLIEDPGMLELMRNTIHGLIWSGTSLSSEGVRFLQQDVFDHTCIVGLYGNTLMGIAGQRPPQEEDRYPAIFHSFFPYSILELVDLKDNTRIVDYYETGQVKITLLTREMFIPNNLERDQAVRIPPSGEFFTWDGVADVKPVTVDKGHIIEGVY